MDKITAINRVEVQNIHFDIENKVELFKQSRELAYQKAFDKASQYAKLSGRKIGQVLTISEEISRDVTNTRMFTNNVQLQKFTTIADESLFDDSSVPTGE